MLRIYDVDTCLAMIARYEREARNEDKPQRWRDIASASLETWRMQLARSTWQSQCATSDREI